MCTSPVFPLAVLALAPLLTACGGVARVDLDPTSLRFGARGQVARVHATPRAESGKALPDRACAWQSTDEGVATVKGHNDAEVTAVGPGSATIRCTVAGVVAELPVIVRVVSRVVVRPLRVELRMTDEPAPTALAVEAFDDTGGPVVGRAAVSLCASEEVCRGDGRAQLWAVGPGDTTAQVEVGGVRSAEIAVHVVDARSAAARPRRVTGHPMEAYEKEYQRRLREAAGK
jgi:hypothetical protein